MQGRDLKYFFKCFFIGTCGCILNLKKKFGRAIFVSGHQISDKVLMEKHFIWDIQNQM